MELYGKESHEYLIFLRKIYPVVQPVVPVEIPPSPEIGVNADGYQISKLA